MSRWAASTLSCHCHNIRAHFRGIGRFRDISRLGLHQVAGKVLGLSVSGAHGVLGNIGGRNRVRHIGFRDANFVVGRGGVGEEGSGEGKGGDDRSDTHGCWFVGC